MKATFDVRVSHLGTGIALRSIPGIYEVHSPVSLKTVSKSKPLSPNADCSSPVKEAACFSFGDVAGLSIALQVDNEGGTLPS